MVEMTPGNIETMQETDVCVYVCVCAIRAIREESLFIK